jgi:hypothetical protein
MSDDIYVEASDAGGGETAAQINGDFELSECEEASVPVLIDGAIQVSGSPRSLIDLSQLGTIE